jgi:hypothetical protein
VVAVEGVNACSPWGTVNLWDFCSFWFSIFSCWKSLSLALKSSLFLLIFVGGEWGGGGIFLGIFSSRFSSA